MHKLTPLALIAVSTLILGGCTKKNTSQTPSQTVNEATEFAKAIESGRPTLCVMTKDDDQMEFKVKGKLISLTTTTLVNGAKTVGHMINDGTYLYTWDDKTSQGSKIAIPKDEVAPSAPVESPTSFSDSKDYEMYQNQGYTINCSAQSFDDTIFAPPANIKFIDPSAMMRNIPSPNAAGEFDMSQLQDLKNKIQLPVEPPTEE